MTLRGGRVIVRLAALCAGALMMAGCDPGPGGPKAEPGPVDVMLSTPRTDDGALMFSMNGGGVDSITARGYGLYSSRTGPESHRVVVSGDIVDGPVARIWIRDRSAIGAYTLSIEQIASSVTYEQRQAAGYVLSLRRP